MTGPETIHTHCPDCDRASDWPADSTYRVCPCGWERFKLRVALPFGHSEFGELLWAKGLGESRYELDTVPFAANGLNAGDWVRAIPPVARPEALPEVVEVLRPSGRVTFRVRFSGSDPEVVDAFFATLPKDIGREAESPFAGAFDVSAGDVEHALHELERAEKQGLLIFADNAPVHAGRFDNLRADLLWSYASFGASSGQPEPTAREPISDEALEKALWEGLGWQAETLPSRIRLRLLSSREVRARSKGAVTLPRTINPRSYAPKHLGLFAPEIWGHPVGRGAEGLRETYGDFKAPLVAPEGYFGPGGHVELPFVVQHPWFPTRSHPSLRFNALPVLPPGHRPVFAVEGGRTAIADVNYLYMHVLDLTHRADVQPGDVQAAVDALFMNEALDEPATLRGDPLVSLRAQLGSKPAEVLEELNALLESGTHTLEGPLPKAQFRLLRALEACWVVPEVA